MENINRIKETVIITSFVIASFFPVFWLISCSGGNEVKFSSEGNEGSGGETDSSPAIGDSQKGPQVNITRYPKDHLLGESTEIDFEIVPGDSPISFWDCFLDGVEVECERGISQKLFEGLLTGKHFFKVYVEDNKGLSGENEADWLIYEENSYGIRKLSIRVKKPENKADILFVVDNSKSMQEEQKGIADRINSLFSKISGLDWRLGIITTDPYEFQPLNRQYNPLADGALLQFPDGSYQLSVSLGVSRARELFSQTIFRPETGNGHERGIHNTYRALERAINPRSAVDQRLKNFFRSSAVLSVILISDENETLLDGVNNLLPDQEKSRGNNLIGLIRKGWPNKKFQFNSVIVRPGDLRCGDEDTSVGQAYFELSMSTGGVVADICSNDYGSALDKIGENVTSLERNYLLDCEPLDRDGDGQADIKLTDSSGTPLSMDFNLRGQNIEFNENLNPGTYEVSYYCVGQP